jgi:hypothetical protein
MFLLLRSFPSPSFPLSIFPVFSFVGILLPLFPSILSHFSFFLPFLFVFFSIFRTHSLVCAMAGETCGVALKSAVRGRCCSQRQWKAYFLVSWGEGASKGMGVPSLLHVAPSIASNNMQPMSSSPGSPRGHHRKMLDEHDLLFAELCLIIKPFHLYFGFLPGEFSKMSVYRLIFCFPFACNISCSSQPCGYSCSNSIVCTACDK